jgi:hypothetical protein
MASNINTLIPRDGPANTLTSEMRANMLAAKTEIEALQTAKQDKAAGFSGYSLTLGATVSSATIETALTALFDFGYLAPTISLSATPAQSIREKGDTVASAALSAVTVKRAAAITAVTFYRDASLINTVASPNASGGTETYTDSTGFADTTSYTAKVNDGTTLVTSNTVTFTYVYPYYYGVGAIGLSAAQVAALTKSIVADTNSKAFTSSPTGQVFYFAYPAAYGALTSILDTNGFETISDYIVRTENITGLDSTVQSYYIYEFNHVTTQVNFTNTFKK